MKTLIAIVSFVLALSGPEGDAPSKKSEADLYAKATKALDAERWTAAIAAFRRVAQQNGSRADSALYWMAHAQFKAGRAADALETLGDLRDRFPKSQWIDDSEALAVEIRQSGAKPMAPETIGDDDLKLIAITSLMSGDPDRAVAMIQKMLAGKSSDEVKERSLFVLGQLNSPKARTLLESYARNGGDPETQRQAIRSLGVAGKENGALLAEVYRSGSRETKEAVIEALMVSGDHARLLQIAESDSAADMRAAAAQKLGLVRGTKELTRLYEKETSREVKDAILQGLFLAGDVDTLSRLARTEPDLELRHTAIRGLGMTNDERGRAVLMELWASNGPVEVKEAVIEALFIRNEASTLIAFARKETNPRLRRELVQKLSVMPSAEARAYMQELLDK
jgi:tetratricopeptide (TPR) repeat protein